MTHQKGKLVLTQNQKKALLWWMRDEKISVRFENSSTGYYALKSGLKKIEATIKNIEWAIKNGVLTSKQIERIKTVLNLD